MIFPSTIPELEELIEDLDREIEDLEAVAYVTPREYAALRVNITRARSKLAHLRTAGAPGPEPRPYSRSADVRAWATARGLECPANGPVPKALQAAYDAAHAGTTRRLVLPARLARLVTKREPDGQPTPPAYGAPECR